MKTEQEMLQAILEARKVVNEIDNKLSAAKEVKTKAEAELIEYMDERDLKSFKSAMFPCTVSRRETLYVSMNAADKEGAMRFIEEECGRGDIIKRSVHNKTLSSFIGKRLKDAEHVPQELFTYYWKPELSVRMS